MLATDGGKDSGACGTYSYEKNIALSITLKLGERLEAHGIDTAYTRTSDTYTDLTKVAGIANTAKADYFISVHCNANPNTSARGTETYAYTAGGFGEKLANAVQDELIKIDGVVNRGVKFANFAVLRMTDMPAVLIETMFISNVEEEQKLNDPNIQETIVEAITKGVCNFLNIQYIAPAPVSPYDGLAVEVCTQDLMSRGIITDNTHWNAKAYADSDIAWFFKKAYVYASEHGGSVKNPNDFDWLNVLSTLNDKGIISDQDKWNEKAYCDHEVLWLLVKTFDYLK